jgi:ankyrin repeat protein
VYGNTPFWVVLMYVRHEVGSVVRLLLEEGASPGAASDLEVTPRNVAARVANFGLGSFITH